jgi:hypothetical protein
MTQDLLCFLCIGGVSLTVGSLPVNIFAVSDVEKSVWFIVSDGVTWYVLTCLSGCCSWKGAVV